MHLKPAVAECRFAFCAGQRIFLFGLWVQKNRKVLADGQVAQTHQSLRCAANHHPVTVSYLQTKQGIANRTTDQENLHFVSLAALADQLNTGLKKLRS